MLAALLADRFKLTFDRGERKMPVLAITKAKGPLKLKSSVADPSMGPGIGFNGPGSMTIRNATLTDFARMFQRYIADRPVIDTTGIDGRFDFSLLWKPDPLEEHGGTTSPTDDRSDLYAAFREQ